jgi:hypothetical protein
MSAIVYSRTRDFVADQIVTADVGSRVDHTARFGL